MEDSNSCPAFFEREGLDDSFLTTTPRALDSPTISRLTDKLNNSLLNSPAPSPAFGAHRFDTPPTPPRFNLFNSPKQTPTTPTSSAALRDISNDTATTPYNSFLKRRCLQSPRRSSSVSQLPIRWDEDTRTLTTTDDSMLTSPGPLTRKRALTQSTPDFSKLLVEEKVKLEAHYEEERLPCILPVIPNSATDYNRIDPHVVNSLLNGEYDDRVEKFVIMDCRFDYEYDGGHIRGAINMSPQKLFDYFADSRACKGTTTKEIASDHYAL